jgi:quaternary ammonium compound-resistance protein SugE
MSWLILLLAGGCEVVWAVALKYWGFRQILPSIGILAAMGASVGLLSLALRSLPVGTTYAIWTGIGVVGTTTLGLFLFGESAAPLRLICIGLILLGMIGLKFVS